MTRKSELLHAELEVAELEDALVEAKANEGTKKALPPEEYRQLKADLRQARKSFRELRSG